MREERLHRAFIRHQNWTYSLTQPQILSMLPGIPAALSRIVAPTSPGRTNCTVFGAWLICAIWSDVWHEDLWLDIQVGRGSDRPWSGIEGLEKRGVGKRDDRLRAPGIYAVQSWSRLTPEGKIETREGRPKSFGHFRVVSRLGRDSQLYVREASQSKGGVVASVPSVNVVPTWGHEVRAVRLID